MNLETAFDDFQVAVNVNPDDFKAARDRRDLFRGAFSPETNNDVLRTLPSGSLARGTHIDPINDVDMIVIFKPEDHKDWGEFGPSAEQALQDLRDRVHTSLGQKDGTFANEVRRVDVKNHSLKCFLDDPDAAGAFTVDLVPALEYERHLLIPERLSEKWIETDPEYLMDAVANRHASWNKFVPLVRLLKRWNRDHGAHMKSLLVEVLAFDYLPEDERPQAIHKFFTAARQRIYDPIEDPSELSGPIQPDLDKAAVYEEIDRAEGLAFKAVLAENEGDIDLAICLWRELFGNEFPEPPGGCPEKSKLGEGLMVGGTASALGPKKIIDAPQG